MNDPKRKKLTGSAYKKKRLAKENEQRKLSGSIENFVFPYASTFFSVPDTTLEKDIEYTVDTPLPVEIIHENLKDNQDKLKDDDEQPCDLDQDSDQDLHSMIASDLNIVDPASWKNFIIEKGPIQVKGIDYPKEDPGRHFPD